MSSPRIQVNELSKVYRLGSTVVGHRTLREAIMSRLASSTRPAIDERQFLALDDVSFDVDAGDVVGIIGRNGSGKSTLLKILGRITPPSAGTIDLRGRVASLLEVGTGFHPELTGRENVFLNGAILGMTRREIQQKFDDIVEFSETGKFLDTPLKRYSSGMKVRLAFAVAAHLDTDILLVDEVLAVGDAQFQRRCLGKMSEIVRDGRTVMFVSHDVNAIRRLCPRSLWLDKGKMREYGDTTAVLSAYLDGGTEGRSRIVLGTDREYSVGHATAINLSHASGEPGHRFVEGEAWNAELGFRLHQTSPRVCASLSVVNTASQVVRTYQSTPADYACGDYVVNFFIDDPLSADDYLFHINITSGGMVFYQENFVPGITITRHPDTVVSVETAPILTPRESGPAHHFVPSCPRTKALRASGV